jgi:RNA exonuclease 1
MYVITDALYDLTVPDNMFSSLGLFQTLSCPEGNACTRPTCIFSHRSDLPPPPSLQILIDEPKRSTQSTQNSSLTTSKRTAAAVDSPVRTELNDGISPGEPPRKIQKLNTQRALAVPTATHTSVMFPITSILHT